MHQNPDVALSALEEGLAAPTLQSATAIWKHRLGNPKDREPARHKTPPSKKRKESLNNIKHRLAEGDGWQFLKHSTISRDQTAESNYEQEQLVVLIGRATDEELGRFQDQELGRFQ